jgi:hypothetical protein
MTIISRLLPHPISSLLIDIESTINECLIVSNSARGIHSRRRSRRLEKIIFRNYSKGNPIFGQHWEKYSLSQTIHISLIEIIKTGINNIQKLLKRISVDLTIASLTHLDWIAIVTIDRIGDDIHSYGKR